MHQITILASPLLTVPSSWIFWRKFPSLETLLEEVKIAKKMFLNLESWELFFEVKTQSQLVVLTCHKEAKAKHGPDCLHR